MPFRYLLYRLVVCTIIILSSVYVDTTEIKITKRIILVRCQDGLILLIFQMDVGSHCPFAEARSKWYQKEVVKCSQYVNVSSWV